ncbi:MAG: BBP7 family outer membrane beta-barrel protein [Pirellulales bacterium]|nr:BBP7 family outer membrane beta-barrel protein [Pirellulales bacterium]
MTPQVISDRFAARKPRGILAAHFSAAVALLLAAPLLVATAGAQDLVQEEIIYESEDDSGAEFLGDVAYPDQGAGCLQGDLAGSCGDFGEDCDDSVYDPGYACYRPLIPISGLQARWEYLLWWTQGSAVPPLVTTSPQGTTRDQAGVLGQDTSILFGDTGLTGESRSGGRIAMTWWMGPARRTGIEGSYFGLGSASTLYRAASTGDPILARPFFNIGEGEQDARLITFDGLVTGSVAVDATTELQGVEVLLRRSFFRQQASHTDFVFGYRFGRLDDGLLISESTVSTDPLTVGTTFDLFDQFDTENRFHGAELGVIWERKTRRWTWEVLMKLALGNTHSRVFIDGSTTTTAPDTDPVVTSGGLLALPTNMGVYDDNHFTVMPELGITVGYDLTRRLRATFGYTLFYWSRVARPGDQIDFDVNDSQFSGGTLSGAPRPEFSWVPTDFWAQGLNFGLEYRF